MRAYATAPRIEEPESEQFGFESRLALLPERQPGERLEETFGHRMLLRKQGHTDRPGQPDEPRLTSVRRFVTQAAEEAGLDPHRVFDLTLAASEACANAIEHGQGDDYLCVAIRREAAALRVEITSPGRFDANVGRRRVPYDRGLGLPLMIALTDEVSFARLPDGGTRVSLAVDLQGAARPTYSPNAVAPSQAGPTGARL